MKTNTKELMKGIAVKTFALSLIVSVLFSGSLSSALVVHAQEAAENAPVVEAPTAPVVPTQTASETPVKETVNETANEAITPAVEAAPVSSGGGFSVSTKTNEVTDAGQGSITVCKVIVDNQGRIATSSQSSGGVSAGVFTVVLTTATTTGTSTAATQIWNGINFHPNTNIPLISTQQNAECSTYGNLTIGGIGYFYSRETITGTITPDRWLTPKYNDQHLGPVQSINDFYAFDPANTNSDGNIILTPERPNRTLVVLNTFVASSTATNTPPQIRIEGENPMVLKFGAAYVEAGAVAIDLEDGGDITHRLITTGTIDTQVSGEQRVTYSVTDNGGLTTTKYRRVFVLPQTMYLPQMPMCSGNFGKATHVANSSATAFHKGFNYSERPQDYITLTPGDLTDGDKLDWFWVHVIGLNNHVEWDLGTSTHNVRVYPGQDHGPYPTEFHEYEVQVSADGNTWVAATSTATYVDDINNVRAHDGVKDYASATAFRYVKIVPVTMLGVDYEIDAVQACQPTTNTPPQIILNGVDPIILNLGTAFVDPQVTAFDAEDGPFAWEDVVVTGSVNTSVVGSYQLTYTVTDSGGLSASVSRTVNVVNLSSQCQRVDLNGDGNLNSADFDMFRTLFDAGDMRADFNNDGTLNILDHHAFTNAFAQCGGTTGGGGGGGGGTGGGGGGTGGGGGGSFSSGGGSGFVTPIAGEVLGVTTECNYLNSYLKRGQNNDMVEVMKLQSFLKTFEGFNTVEINGIFDDATFDAVSAFQKKYGNDILTPWGYEVDSSTGYVYILTKKKVNEIYCKKQFDLTTEQQREISQFRTMMYELALSGTMPTSGNVLNNVLGEITATSTENTTLLASLKDNLKDKNGTLASLFAGRFTDTESMKSLAAAVFTIPHDRGELLQSIYYLLIILFVIYILTSVAINMQNTAALSRTKIRTRKAIYFSIGLIIALVGAMIYQVLTIVVPLVILLIGTLTFLVWNINKREATPNKTSGPNFVMVTSPDKK